MEKQPSPDELAEAIVSTGRLLRTIEESGLVEGAGKRPDRSGPAKLELLEHLGDCKAAVEAMPSGYVAGWPEALRLARILRRLNRTIDELFGEWSLENVGGGEPLGIVTQGVVFCDADGNRTEPPEPVAEVGEDWLPEVPRQVYEELAEDVGRLAEYVEAEQAEDGSENQPASGVPAENLFGWYEIAEAVGRRNDRSERDRIKRLNDMYGGPIVVPKQGAQPVVRKSELVKWWNGLADRAAELQQRDADRQGTVEFQHEYGRDGTVVPEVNGEVKKRRKDRKP